MMTLTALAALTITVSATADAAIERRIAVCPERVPGHAQAVAQAMAADMFARIGVKLEWRDVKHCPSEALQIRLSIHTPADLRPGALGYALPFDGAHIAVFWDRIQSRTRQDNVAPLLAHVLAHEITHILQAQDRHSDKGLMKAQWNPADFSRMATDPLPFTSEDIDLICTGMARRTAVLEAAAQMKQYHSEAAVPNSPDDSSPAAADRRSLSGRAQYRH
jgi:hypothetical protein